MEVPVRYFVSQERLFQGCLKTRGINLLLQHKNLKRKNFEKNERHNLLRALLM